MNPHILLLNGGKQRLVLLSVPLFQWRYVIAALASSPWTADRDHLSPATMGYTVKIRLGAVPYTRHSPYPAIDPWPRAVSLGLRHRASWHTMVIGALRFTGRAGRQSTAPTKIVVSRNLRADGGVEGSNQCA